MQKRKFISENSSLAKICRKDKNSYLRKSAAEREICLSAKTCRKGLYKDVAAQPADAHLCRIGLKAQPYPIRMCIAASRCLSAKIRNSKIAEVAA